MSENPFKIASDKIKQEMLSSEAQAEYMSDDQNYLLVHTTDYMPLTNKNGEQYIPSTAMATDYQHIRSTVHTTLNHVVKGNSGGDWGDKPYIILAPYRQTIEKNGAPAQLCLFDTFFAVHPDRGLMLPSNTHIIMPAHDLPDGELVQTKDNTTLYKIHDFTPEQEEELLSKMAPYKLDEYNKAKTGQLNSWEINNIVLQLGKVGQKLYNASKDKSAFIRGIMADKCESLLAEVARDQAVKTTITQMGFRAIEQTYEGSDAAVAVEKFGTKHNIDSTSSNKGHFYSMYNELEMVCTLVKILYDNIVENSDAVEKLESYITQSDYIPLKQQLMNTLLSNKPFDLHGAFSNVFNTSDLRRYMPAVPADATISDWDPNVATAIDRFCAIQAPMWEKLFNNIKSLPGYDKFIQNLKARQQMLINDNKRTLG